MEHALAKIVVKPSDYKLCKECGAINWYENGECINCGEKLGNEAMTEEEMKRFEKREYGFWKKEGWTESEIDNLLVEI